MISVPEESEYKTDISNVETRNAFSSPQERTNFDNHSAQSLFGRSSAKQSNLSECLLLGPQNLTKIFDNRHIIEHSETLFSSTGYLTKQHFLHRQERTDSRAHSILVGAKQTRTIDDILNDLNKTDLQNYNDDIVQNLLDELYTYMEEQGMLNAKISSKLKIVILKTLYRFVESKNEQILINIAQIILAVSLLLW